MRGSLNAHEVVRRQYVEVTPVPGIITHNHVLYQYQQHYMYQDYEKGVRIVAEYHAVSCLR